MEALLLTLLPPVALLAFVAALIVSLVPHPSPSWVPPPRSPRRDSEKDRGTTSGD